jgi:hypothetical protein
VTRSSKHEQYIFFAGVLAALLAVVFYYHGRVVSVSQEAMVCSGVGRDLLAGAVEGRQGLVGSLEWPPLPTLLLLPFVKIPHFGSSGLAFPVVNVIISAFTLTLLNGWWARFGVPRLARFLLLALYQASPPVIAAVLTGSSDTMLLLMLMAGAYFLIHWLGTLDLRSLAYLGVLCGLSVVTRYQTMVLVILVVAVITVRTMRTRQPSFRPATLLVFLIPSLYTVSLWFMANWLILGDPVYFLRGLAGGGPDSIGTEITELDVDWYLYLMPLLLLLVAYLMGSRSASSSPPGGNVPNRDSVRSGSPTWGSHLWKSLAVALALVVLLAVMVWPYVTEIRPTPGRESYFGRHNRQLGEVDEIVTYLAERCPEAKVFVSGYTGYQFVARSQHRETFVHLINLDLGEIQRRTRGQQLLFLVPRPKGLYRWEDINLRLPWLFDEYMKHLLLDRGLCLSFVLVKEWPNWHLIEAVRAEKPLDKPFDKLKTPSGVERLGAVTPVERPRP